MKQQGSTFPEMDNPQKIVDEYHGELEQISKETIINLQQFTYARYTPFSTISGIKP